MAVDTSRNVNAFAVFAMEKLLSGSPFAVNFQMISRVLEAHMISLFTSSR
jgi:hypothetical protein